ncbi:MAG: hypothetical protein K8T89_11770 [Planctomycetes bacterium]|nr:hypothetical protein [Planctomycetota bacterium]
MTSELAPNGTNGTNGPDWAQMQRRALIVGVAGLVLFTILSLIRLGMGDGGVRQFFTSYLTAWTFWLSFPIGCMGLLGIQNVTGASWGVLLRRPFEACTRTLPLLAVLFLPLAISVFIESASPYPWSTAPEKLSDVTAEVEELTHKFNDWSNPPGYLVRMVLYFAIWGVFIFLTNKWGQMVEQTNDPKARRSMENLSGPMVMVFALGNMFAATDIVMSMELHFSSTMFPLIYCINQLLTCLCFGIALFLTFAANQPSLKAQLRPKFQIDMGSFMLALTLVWCYMNFSQYMLIWIGNLPEEIPYYLKRTNGGWEYVAYFMCIFHFVVPFLLLLFRDVKLHPKRLRAIAIGLIVVCSLDVVWWIEAANPHKDGGPIYLFMDYAAIVGIGGIWGWLFLNQLKKHPLLPTNYLAQLPGGHHGH